MKYKLKKALRLTVSYVVVGFMILSYSGPSCYITTIHAEENGSDTATNQKNEQSDTVESEKQETLEEKEPEVFVQEDTNKTPLATSAVTGEINIGYYDENNVKISSVETPNPITFKVEDENGVILDEANFDIFWYAKVESGDVKLGKGNTLALTYTSYLNTGGYPIKALVTEKATSTTRELEAGNYATFNNQPLLIFNHKPVYKGTTVDGVTLSDDGKTITLNNVNITDTTEDFWTSGVLYFLSFENELTINLQGNNTITTSETNGLSIGLFNEVGDTNVNITGGGTLNVNVTSDKDTTNKAISIYGSKNNESLHNVNFDGGVTLNLSSTTSIEAEMSGATLDLSNMTVGKVTVGDAEINATGDGENTISILVPQTQEKVASLYVGPQGKISAKNQFHLDYSVDVAGGAHVAAFLFTGDTIDIDGGKVECYVERQTAGQINAFFANNATTTVKNKGELTVANHAKDGNLGKHTEELGGIVSVNLIVDNANVNSDMGTVPNSLIMTGGIFYANDLTIINDSNVNININGGRYRGIAYGGSNFEDAQEKGKIFIKDSNVNVNAKTNSPQSGQFELICTGVEGHYLTTEMTNDKHSININTSSENMPTLALFLQRLNSDEKVNYDPLYVSNRFVLKGLSGIITPENGRANVYSYIEDEENPVYVVADTIYGEDGIKPAENITISNGGYEYKEAIDSKHKLSVTGLIDKNAVLTVTSDLHKDCPVCEKMNGIINPLFLGDVSLTNAETPYKGDLGITFEVDAKYNGKTLTLLHCVNKNVEQLEATVNDGKISFEVSSLSPFALYDISEQPVVMNYHTIKTTAGENGTISETGDVNVLEGESHTFKFMPNAGYKVASVVVDGKEVKPVGTSYTFENITSNHTLHVEFTKSSPETGDRTQTMVFAGLLLLSGVAVLMSLQLKKRKV